MVKVAFLVVVWGIPLPGKDIVCNSSDVIFVTQSSGKGKHQSGLAGSNGSIQVLAMVYTYVYSYRPADIQRHG